MQCLIKHGILHGIEAEMRNKRKEVIRQVLKSPKNATVGIEMRWIHWLVDKLLFLQEKLQLSGDKEYLSAIVHELADGWLVHSVLVPIFLTTPVRQCPSGHFVTVWEFFP